MQRIDAVPHSSAQSASVVQNFYDKHPYPPPVSSLDAVRTAWTTPGRLRADYHLFWPDRSFRTELEILVAGCGTSQAAEYAVRYPDAHVLGIDFSATSVRETEALKQAHALHNLTVTQLPIEQVQELGQRFDKIICTGVLHHLPDPGAGLAALRSVLKEDGALHLMLYASYGRTGIYMMQAYAHRLGIGTSDAEIRDLVAVLMELPAGHPLEHLLREAPDFRRKDALADALLNPLDRAYTVPELYELLARNGLAFGRWLRQAPYLPQCGALATTPHGSRLAQLPAAEQHAAVELFRGTMVRHSVIAYRDDVPAIFPPNAWDEKRWMASVPLRLPHTRCVEKGLPPGAAGVLLNQSHTYPDLYLPIDAHEKRLFDCIDGRRTIEAILMRVQSGRTNRQSRQHVVEFFRRLWAYDQVVLDASRQ